MAEGQTDEGSIINSLCDCSVQTSLNPIKTHICAASRETLSSGLPSRNAQTGLLSYTNWLVLKLWLRKLQPPCKKPTTKVLIRMHGCAGCLSYTMLKTDFFIMQLILVFVKLKYQKFS